MAPGHGLVATPCFVLRLLGFRRLFKKPGSYTWGDRVRFAPELTLRASEAFNAELEWDYNDIDLPGGGFETNLGRLRTSYSFSPRVFVQALIQYNDRAGAWAANLRFGWLQRANTGLFIVYERSGTSVRSETGEPLRVAV